MASHITGVIKDGISKEPIESAIVKLVRISDNEVLETVLTDKTGTYYLSDIEESIYLIEASKPGYYKNALFDFSVEIDHQYECNIELLQRQEYRREHGKSKRRKVRKEDNSEYCFMIGSIEVKSHGVELIPEETVTTRKISSGEIEHLQATNLGDVLNLVPGIEKTQNPGLSKTSRVGIRSTSLSGVNGALESFGTTVIVDDLDMASVAAANPSDSKMGVDLRNIPADNIESVEVISGIPSVEYGDFSNGLIKVKTKSGYIKNKLKVKLNPDTKTASYSGGKKFSESTLDYHLNYGYSEKDLRKEGDEFHRYYGSLGYYKLFLEDRLDTRFKWTFTKTFEGDEPIGPRKTRDYDEGFQTSGSFSFDYERSETSKLSGIFNLKLRRKKNFDEKWVSEQLLIGDTVVTYEGGTYHDTLLAGYVGKKQDKGYEVSFGSNLKYKKTIEFGNLEHKLLSGISSKYDKNSGDGLVLNHLFNYYGVYSTRRSFSYSDYDPIGQYSLFFEDNITGDLFSRKFNLMMGVRYTAINPKGFDFSNGILDTKNGEFFCPRFNFRYFINQNLRIRFGAGISAKTVSMGYLNRYPAYFKYLDQEGNLVEEMAIQNNPDLKAYTSNKLEASVDWKPIPAVGFSLTSYYTTSDDMPSTVSYPLGYNVNPDTITSSGYSKYQNIGWKDSWGIEFVLQTKRFYNLQYRMNIAYRYSDRGREGKVYDSSPNSSYGETIWYKPYSQWSEKIIIDYQVNYVSQRLGLWVTLEAQHVPVENRKTKYNSVKYEKNIEGEIHTFYQGMTNWYDDEAYDYGGRWLLNLRITKSINQKTGLSLYINNLLDDRALWNHPFRTSSSDVEKNPEIYYGLEISTTW